MKVAPKPADEEDRLAVLRSYGILDTPPEERFDRLVRLVSEQLDVPISLISLVDAHRQWFKAGVGLDARETPRNLAFCAHAILSEDTLVVENALSDDRFRDNPLVASDPSIRFYAGSPLITASGHRVGTLCAIDREPRQLSESKQSLLRTLASVVVDEMELSATSAALEQHTQQLESRNESLDAFVHSLSHDLAGPLRRIKGFCEILESDPEAEQGECIQYISSSALSAERLLEALRSYFLVDRAEEPVECDARECLRRAESGLAAELKSESARLEVTGNLPKLRFFPELLTLLFTNLISNALKYRSERAPAISIHAEEREDAWAFIVDDNGIGIEEKHRGNALKLLFRLHRDCEIPGSGMGLAICEKIVRRGGGEIRLDQSDRGGTRVTFSLAKA